MNWTILTDNRATACQGGTLETEHGLSVWLETTSHKLLLDTGASDVFVRNAERLGIDLGDVDYVFLSHGHNDHAGGLRHFLRLNQRAKILVSPFAVNGKFFSRRGHQHSISTHWPELPQDRLVLIDRTCEVAEGLHVMARIPQRHAVPKGNRHLFVRNEEGTLVADDFRHELALYADGLLFTGCAHSGLENILEACRWPVHTVVGGFHLLDGCESAEELTALAGRLRTTYPHTQFFTSHCTGDRAFGIMKQVMGEQLQAFSNH